MFEALIEQEQAKQLLGAALREGPAHAYLFHGPAGVGKRRAAIAFAAELLGDGDRVERRAHPDLYVLEPHGDQIRIDDVRELRRDLHMRPFEGDRRVYLIFDAHLLNAEAADSLLKDLEEPPPYAVVVLAADELGPIPETIRSRCQLVPFQRLSERAVRAEAERLAPGLSPERADRRRAGRCGPARPGRASARPGRRPPAGRAARSRARRVRRPGVRSRRGRTDGDGARGRARRRGAGRRRGGDRRARACRTGRPSSTSAAPSAERSVRRSCSRSTSWRRGTATSSSSQRGPSAPSSTTTASPSWPRTRPPSACPRAEQAAEVVRGTWRTFEEFNVTPALALEAMFVRIRRELRRCHRPRLSALQSETRRRAQVFFPVWLSRRNRRRNLTEKENHEALSAARVRARRPRRPVGGRGRHGQGSAEAQAHVPRRGEGRA